MGTQITMWSPQRPLRCWGLLLLIPAIHNSSFIMGHPYFLSSIDWIGLDLREQDRLDGPTSSRQDPYPHQVMFKEGCSLGNWHGRCFWLCNNGSWGEFDRCIPGTRLPLLKIPDISVYSEIHKNGDGIAPVQVQEVWFTQLIIIGWFNWIPSRSSGRMDRVWENN